MKKFVLNLLVVISFLGVPVWADEELNASLTAFSQKAEVVSAMKEFSVAVGKIRSENGVASVDDMKKEVFSYYEGDFANEYKSTTNKAPDLVAAKSIDDDAVALQYYYIIKNTAKNGKKNHFTDAKDKSSWTKSHVKYHEMFESFAHDKHGLYDLFLVDLAGRIVYSVFKEIDFATRLDGGPYASSGLGTMFKEVKDAAKGEVKTSKNTPYFPSYEDNAEFVGTSLYDGDKKIGILVVQLPSW